MGAAGAKSKDVDSKVGRVKLTRGGKSEVKRTNIMETIQPGDTVTNMNPGGGGYGNPYERPIEKVVWDVKNGLVSVKGARDDYGVVIADPETLDVDMAATKRLRSAA
jgi:N-methylhydantoinase B